MVTKTAVIGTVKSFILDEFLPGEDPSMLTPTTPLMSAGILDSLATLKLITFLEKEYDIKIAAYEADVEYLDTLSQISQLVDSKR